MLKNFRCLRMCVWIWSRSLAVFVWLVASVAFAAETGTVKSGPPEGQATTITAQKMTVRNQENKAYFEGTVVLIKGALVVHSDAMVVSFKPKETPGERPSDPSPVHSAEGEKKPKVGEGALPTAGSKSISMVEATGRVKIEKEGGTATCEKAVYYEDGEKIVLTGEPIAWQKGTKVTGKVITMYLAEDRSVVEGESRVLIEPEPGGGR
jgi:lipopolysaccharide export system protein LptA